ncbi:MFS transporter [Nonomuraea sp. NPDC050547]|uniref:MFS transporter n=1 Tax=unclassified Nonomuraea TaxID=2593643 RepID=UPI0037AB166D
MTSTETRDERADAVTHNRWWVLAVMSAAVLIIVIDITVLHIASPRIAEALRPSPVSLLWIIDVYPLVVAPLLVAASTLGDRFGRKRMLIVGLVVFTLASALAAYAWSPAALIGARAAQGLGGALVMPNAMAIIRAVFPDRRERAQAIGIWSALLAGGAAAGPLLGGFLVEHFWWGAVFLINVPVLAVVLPFAVRLLPESRHSAPPPWDTLSVLLVAGGVLGLAYGIKEGVRHGFLAAWSIMSLTAATILLILFVMRQLRRDQPLLNIRLFTRPVFAVSSAGVLLVVFALVGLELYFAQYLQLVLGLSPSQASLRLLPLLAATFAGSLIAAPVLQRLGTRMTLAAGFGLSAAALPPLLALDTRPSYALLWIPFVVLGLALEAAMVAANDAMLSAVSVDDAGQAGSIESTVYELGGGIGVAVLGAVGVAIYSNVIGPVAGLASSDQAIVRTSITEAAAVAHRLPGTAGQVVLDVARDAWLSGFRAVVVVATVLITVGALMSLIFVPRRNHAE